MDWQTFIQPSLIILVPLVVTQIRRVVGTHTWLLPIIAPLVGVVADLVSHYATGVSVGAGNAAVLGMAGVGLREVVDQLRHDMPEAVTKGPVIPAPTSPSVPPAPKS